jgi:ribonuclease R
VKSKTALDKEARARGNSVYFPGKVIPMLPEVLSNGLCSLKPEVERLCMVCELSISAAGKITRYAFHEGIMCSHARLTYTKVAALLKGESTHLLEQYRHLLPHIQELNHLFQALKAEREIRGAIEFETVETRILFNPEGKISRIEPTERNDAHRIIEECMLCANVATARFLKKHKLPGLYRNHEGPQTEKLADLKTFLSALGLSLKAQKIPTPLDYAALLRSVQNMPDVNIIQTVLLRSLSQAVYSPDNMGHFGLAYPAYCHFTSPIRRYPDLLIHRQIKSVLKGKWDATKVPVQDKQDPETKALIELGIHTSMAERRADDATRDAVRWLKCEYIQKHIGEVFEGVISGVTRFGFFVELKEIYIDGLIHVNSLRNDYYQYDPIHHRLLGERTGIQYRIGDFVTVKVAKVDVPERKIDFELMGVPTSSTPRQKSKSSFSHKKNKSKPHAKPIGKKKAQPQPIPVSKPKSKPKAKSKSKPKPKAKS